MMKAKADAIDAITVGNAYRLASATNDRETSKTPTKPPNGTHCSALTIR